MLDVHSAHSEDAASKMHPVCSFEIDILSGLFQGGADMPTAYPMLNRMRDYFSDCTFAPDALPTLASEIDRFLMPLGPKHPYRPTLTQFRDACQTAITNGHSLLLFCD